VENSPDQDQTLRDPETVRCLDCRTLYVKPADGGTLHRNPGCPACGYLGWVTASAPARRAGRFSRAVAE
jgi:hypothetical protein